MPACATRYAGRPAISWPRKRTEPAVGLSAPAIRLKVVLFPEPLGPMRPRISPSATWKETFLTAKNPSKLLVSPLTCNTCLYRSLSRSLLRESVALGEGEHGVRGLDLLRPGDARAAVDVLHHDRKGALVLAGKRVAGRIELHAVALHRAADRDVGLERGLAQRLGIEAAVLLDRARQDVVQQDPGVVEAHRDMRRQLARSLHCLVALHHLLREVPDSGLERLRVEELRGRRVDRVEVVDVLAESLAQLVDLAVPRAVADDRLHLEALLLRLAQEERDVRVVAGMQQHVGPRALELGDQAREIRSTR